MERCRCCCGRSRWSWGRGARRLSSSSIATVWSCFGLALTLALMAPPVGTFIRARR
ncbi:hypothetical protein CHLRE_12g548750v5 [Chlamydomonas reinhardtii]|uniref:Uncharacterized protein n=1 Tax=Chlamydomonas reinhardtii TaxID=3055 RepID=A0A2K3D6D2_CHLRE|nr:uncharacterized protein CHLRE_12g548750v5 [Chlamydomonas reinhardtii]PNW76077.1 hypothetical protein CHLRE_12g548750v5 [Chlamydomonas reinhardtii]